MRKDGTASRSGRHTVIAGADFETDKVLNPDGTVAYGFICQWAMATVRDRTKKRNDYDVVHGYTLAEFRDHILRLMANRSIDYIIYYHNLRYDLQFMRDLMHELREMCKDDEEPPLEIFRESSPIMLRYRNIEFRDSMKKAPGTTVAELGELVGIPKLESPRGNFDPGWSKDLTDADFQYVEHDAIIVALAMKAFHEQGMVRATISGDAWKSIHTIFNKGNRDPKRPRSSPWDTWFPQLKPEFDDWLRAGYMGGLNISWKRGRFDCVSHIDRHSMYPSVMSGIPSKASGTVPYLPYGAPVQIPMGEDVETWCDAHGYPCYVVRVTCKLHLKKGMMPFYKFKLKNDRVKEGLGSTEYVRNTRCWHELVLTNVDLDTMSKVYDFEFDPDSEVEAYAFKGAPGLFKDYVDYWYEKKKNSPKGSIERTLAKLMLNSAYGRFGMSRYQTEVDMTEDEDVGWSFISIEYLDDETKAYLPVAMWVTAYGRSALIDAVLTVGMNRVIHCDTDSVIYQGPKSLAEPLGNTDALGDWGFEGDPVAIIEGGVKRYVEIFSDEIRSLDDIGMACAGVPQKTKDGIPYGMWIELLDNPNLITETGYELGREHYRVESPWLRALLIKGGKDPDDMDTRKLISGKSTLIRGGVDLKPTTMRLNDGLRIRFGG